MKQDFKLHEPNLLGSTLDAFRCSLAFEGHPLSINVLCRAIRMSPKTYRKLISGVPVVQFITCE